MLVILSAIPLVGSVAGALGFILVLVAVKNISEVLYDKSLFTKMLIAVVLSIGGVALSSLVVIRSIVRLVGLKNTAGSLPFGPNPNLTPFPVGNFEAFFFSILPTLFLIWMIMLAAAIFMRRACDSIGARLDEKTFGTAGWVYLAGASTTIVFVGFFILLVAQIVLARAFFSMRETLPTRQVPTIGTSQPSPSNA